MSESAVRPKSAKPAAIQTGGAGQKIPSAPVSRSPLAQSSNPSNLLAAVRIRSAVDSTTEIRDTLWMLHLRNKNACVVVSDTPAMRGMLVRANPYITWGEVSEGAIEKLKPRMIVKNVFRLHPPRGGFERKGIKVPFKVGGAMGYRGAMDALLERMA